VQHEVLDTVDVKFLLLPEYLLPKTNVCVMLQRQFA